MYPTWRVLSCGDAKPQSASGGTGGNGSKRAELEARQLAGALREREAQLQAERAASQAPERAAAEAWAVAEERGAELERVREALAVSRR